jgi:outer membrane protein TolC
MKKGSYISRKFVMTGVCILLLIPLAGGQERKLTLQEAMDLALRQNRTVQIAHDGVVAELEKQRGARSDYFPTITNDSSALYVTDLQRVQIPPGTFGTTPSIPSSTVFLTQGRNAFQSSGTMLAQPLTQLIKIHEANKIAAADVGISQASLKKASADVVYSVHELYYQLLIHAVAAEISSIADRLKQREPDRERGGV